MSYGFCFFYQAGLIDPNCKQLTKGVGTMLNINQLLPCFLVTFLQVWNQNQTLNVGNNVFWIIPDYKNGLWAK